MPELRVSEWWWNNRNVPDLAPRLPEPGRSPLWRSRFEEVSEGRLLIVTMTLTEFQRAGLLYPGQVVTVLVGVALRLRELHQEGSCGGWLQPRQVTLDSDGRPDVQIESVPEGWQPSDDAVALLRLGAELARGDRQTSEQLRRRCADGTTDLYAVSRWLLTLARPQPLGPVATPVRRARRQVLR